MGEAVTYKGDEEAVELVKAAARDAEGVTLVTDMNAKVGSEDCTMLIRRIQAHGGKCAFFYFGCDHHGHHRLGRLHGIRRAHQRTMTPITPE